MKTLHAGLLTLAVPALLALTGCASQAQWTEWRSHSSHFASGQHAIFSLRNQGPEAREVRATDPEKARMRAGGAGSSRCNRAAEADARSGGLRGLTLATQLLARQRQVDRVTHRVVAEIARVEMIAAVVDRQHARGGRPGSRSALSKSMTASKAPPSRIQALTAGAWPPLRGPGWRVARRLYCSPVAFRLRSEPWARLYVWMSLKRPFASRTA